MTDTANSIEILKRLAAAWVPSIPLRHAGEVGALIVFAAIGTSHSPTGYSISSVAPASR